MRFVIGATAAVIALSAHGQAAVRVCATPVPSAAEVLESSRQASPFAKRSVYFRAEGVRFVIPVAFHVIHDGSQGQVTNKQINAQLQVLNDKLGPLGYLFTRHSISRTDNAVWHTMISGEASEIEAMQTLSIDHTQVLNFYIAKPRDYEDEKLVWVFGLASYPWWLPQTDWWDPRRDGVIVDYATLPGVEPDRFNLGYTGVHEVGHWIGLLHTFNPGEKPEQKEKADGCDSPGDDVADTPDERDHYFGPGLGRACEPPPPRDTCATYGFDPIRNYMDYADDRCMTEWTPGQDYRARSQMQRYRSEFVERSPDVVKFMKFYKGK